MLRCGPEGAHRIQRRQKKGHGAAIMPASFGELATDFL
jgi:hypothetical protein